MIVLQLALTCRGKGAMTLKLNLKGITVSNSEDEKGAAEWRLDIDVGSKHLDWDHGNVKPGKWYPIDEVFKFQNFNTNHDLQLRSGGIEKDKWFHESLPTDVEVLKKADYYDHSFTTTASNKDFEYTLHWDLDMIA
jgi:hypothetical protein